MGRITQEDIELYRMMQRSPLFFIEQAWHLIPQPPKPEYAERLRQILSLEGDDWEEQKNEVTAHWFGDQSEDDESKWNWYSFEKGKHLTWQQTLIITGIEKAVRKTGKPRISVASGRGIGKSRTLAMVILWYLFCFADAQVPCTAPTQNQMYDVLWKEINMCIQSMPDQLRKFYIWESQYIRIKESPYTWFARAKTSSKENPEALSIVTGKHMLISFHKTSYI